MKILQPLRAGAAVSIMQNIERAVVLLQCQICLRQHDISRMVLGKIYQATLADLHGTLGLAGGQDLLCAEREKDVRAYCPVVLDSTGNRHGGNYRSAHGYTTSCP